MSQAIKLDEKQRQQVAQIRAAHGDLDIAYDLTQAFVSMLAEHQHTELDRWLAQAQRRGVLPPVQLLEARLGRYGFVLLLTSES